MASSEPESAPERLPVRLLPALLLLGFSSGLPQPLVDATLSTWLSKAGWTPAELVQVGYVTLPFSLKFLWAPLADRFVPPFLGRRRGWLLGCQLALFLGLLALAGTNPTAGPAALIVAATLVAFASATQDLVVNGLACESLTPARLAGGVGLVVWGYRVATFLSGGLALVVAGTIGFERAYAGMAFLVGLGMLGTWLAPEPSRHAPPQTLRATLIEPLRAWRADLGARGLGLLLLFVLFYRLPDALANLLAVPFQATLYDLQSLGLSRSVVGLLGSAAGVGAAAWCVPRLGARRALLWIGLLQAASNLGYVGLDQRWFGGLTGLVGVLFLENLCGAAAGTVFVAYLMSFCRSASAATQFALLTTVTLLGPHLLREPIAAQIQRLGWSGFFLATVACVVPATLVVLWVPRSVDRKDACSAAS